MESATPTTRKRKRKIALLLCVLGSALVAAFAAYAYFLSSGTGSSTLTTSAGGTAVSITSATSSGYGGCSFTNVAPFTVCVDTIPAGTLQPGTVVPVNYRFFAPNGSNLAGVALANFRATSFVPVSAPGCNPAWFHYNASSAPANLSSDTSTPFASVVPTMSVNDDGVGYLHMDETSGDQSSCQNRNITVNWAVGG